ncbi:hypothetical protein ANN_22724, partial [Periplaneta americana]
FVVGKKKIDVSDEQLAEVIKVDSLRTQMQKAIDRMKEEYVRNLSLRSTTGSIETLSVNFEGKEYELQELAQIVRKNPKTIIVNMTAFPQTIPATLEAIAKSGMNLNPQQDGTTLFIPVPNKEVELLLKEMKNGKATGVDGIPIELVKCLGEDKKQILSLCNAINEKDEWLEDFMDTVLIPILKKNNAKKYERTFGRRAVWLQEGKRYERCNGTAIEIGERYLEKNKEVYVVFVNLEKAFGRVNWNKLMGILKKIGVDWITVQ